MKLEQAADMLSVSLCQERSTCLDLSCNSGGLPTLHASIFPVKCSFKDKGIAYQYRAAQNGES